MDHAAAPSPKHDVFVWVDHHEARVLHLHPDAQSTEATVVRGDHDRPHEKKHDGGHRHPISGGFADRIADAVRSCSDLVLTGPSTAKDELMALLRERHHEIAARVRIVETLDRTTDARLAAHARDLFERADRMRGIHVATS